MSSLIRQVIFTLLKTFRKYIPDSAFGNGKWLRYLVGRMKTTYLHCRLSDFENFPNALSTAGLVVGVILKLIEPLDYLSRKYFPYE